MKHSIKDQIGAVNWARKVVKQVVPTEKKLEQLNDAASTLSALNFIGQDVVLVAPELLTIVREFCKRVEDGEVRSVTTYGKFKAILKRLDHE